jgi:hypothetical protein
MDKKSLILDLFCSIFKLFSPNQEKISSLKYTLSKIIESYGIPGGQAFRWVEFCGGSPRVAHVLGENPINCQFSSIFVVNQNP